MKRSFEIIPLIIMFFVAVGALVLLANCGADTGPAYKSIATTPIMNGVVEKPPQPLPTAVDPEVKKILTTFKNGTCKQRLSLAIEHSSLQLIRDITGDNRDLGDRISFDHTLRYIRKFYETELRKCK